MTPAREKLRDLYAVRGAVESRLGVNPDDDNALQGGLQHIGASIEELEAAVNAEEGGSTEEPEQG